MSAVGSLGLSEASVDPRIAASAIDVALGDPFSDGVVSFAEMVALDEREAYPEDACRALDGLGVHRHYVPADLGGALTSFEELAQIIRVMARRDLTVAIAHGKTFLGAVPVWVGGSESQRRRLADVVLAGGQVALALTERGHGSDLLGIATAAERTPHGYVLSGEKWLINNATRGRAVVVLARTAAIGGPRANSLFLVDKRTIVAGSLQHLPKIKTHGIRGADISGIRFSRAELEVDTLIGGEGHGLEIALKGLLVTRSLITALSLGAADTALRVVLDFAQVRRVRDRSVADLAHPRAVLAQAFADLLACEALSTVAARSLHVVPEQVSLFSAAAKYLVPTTVERLIGNLSVVLGARNYLREGHAHGVFQKVSRDAALVSLFDGSTIVNLSALALQIPRLAAQREKRGDVVDPDLVARRRALFGLEQPLPRFDPKRLSLQSHGKDDVLDALPLAERELAALAGKVPSGAAPAETIVLITTLVGYLRSALREEGETLVLLERSGQRTSDSPEMFELAERHAALFAGATCVHTWLVNRRSSNVFFASGAWLVVALARMLDRAGQRVVIPRAYRDAMFDQLEGLAESDLALSLVPVPLAPRKKPGVRLPREVPGA